MTPFLRLLAVVLGLHTGMAWGFPTAPYFPLVDGYSWSYIVTEAGTAPTTVTRTVQPGSVPVNGVQTKVLRHSEDGYLQYLTSDGNGIRLHQEASPADNETYLLSPPIILAGGDAVEGATWSGSGTFLYSSPFGVFPLAYESTSTVQALESITTHAGSFAAGRLRWTVRVHGSILGSPIDDTTVMTLWVADGIGLVRESASTPGFPEQLYSLSSLSFRPVLTYSVLEAVFPSPQPANGQRGHVAAGIVATNNGTQPVNVQALSTTAGFSASATCVGAHLDPGQECFINVYFEPASPGPHTGTLSVQTDAVGNPFVVPLSGTAYPAAIPQVAPAQLDFGNVPLGGTSAPQTFTLSNAGTADLLIRSIDSFGDYTASSGCPATLSPAASCTVSTVFSPQPPGWGRRDSAVAILFDNFDASRLDVALTGVALAPQLVASPAALDFGAVPTEVTVTKSVTVTNAALVPIEITSALPPPEPFAMTTSCIGTLAPGAACTLNVTYAPGAIAPHAGSVALWYQSGLLSTTVSLSGSGVAPRPTQLLIRGPGNLVENASAQYVAYAQWNDGSRVPVAVSWSSSDPARASIAADGTLTLSALDSSIAVTLVASYEGTEGPLSATWTLTAIDTASPPPSHPTAVSAGWTLLGAGLAASTDVVQAFGNVETPVPGLSTQVAALWKWNAASSRWAFYSPLLSLRGNTLYAAEHGYDLLGTLQPGEGFWINALDAATLPDEIGVLLAADNASFDALPPGWNLLANGAGLSPSQYNFTVSPAEPPAGTVPQNFFALWQWDSAQSKWWFYSPLLEADGGAAAVKSYAEANGHLDFETVYPPFTDAPKRLGIGEGFWVNKP